MACYEYKVKDWNELIQLASKLANNWIFRGQKEKWDLTTTLDRATSWQEGDSKMFRKADAEIKMLEEFKRNGHLHLQNPPEEKEYIEWLALLQHYGGFTRLLDFTESFFNALHFSVKSSEQENAAVWCFDRRHINKAIKKTEHIQKITTYRSYKEEVKNKNSITEKKLEESREDFLARYLANLSIKEYALLSPTNMSNDVEELPDLDLVIEVKPWRLNDRLAAQQGLFLFPMGLTRNFDYYLEKTLDVSTSSLKNISKFNEFLDMFKSNPKILKIVLPNMLFSQILYYLRQMNISDKTLFPNSLDGFARNLNYFTRNMFSP